MIWNEPYPMQTSGDRNDHESIGSVVRRSRERLAGRPPELTADELIALSLQRVKLFLSFYLKYYFKIRGSEN